MPTLAKLFRSLLVNVGCAQLTNLVFRVFYQDMVERSRVGNSSGQGNSPGSSSGNFYFVADFDQQYALYNGGLPTSVWGNFPDNEQLMQTGRGLLYPRTYMLLFYRYRCLACQSESWSS